MRESLHRKKNAFLIIIIGFNIARIVTRERLDITSFTNDTISLVAIFFAVALLPDLFELKKPEWKHYLSLYAFFLAFVVTTLWLGVQAYYALTGKQADLLGIPAVGFLWLFSLLNIIVKGYTLRSSSRVQ
ncbi:MAG: hypothetical protein QXI84_07295 [Thermofilaceae archaeon]